MENANIETVGFYKMNRFCTVCFVQFIIVLLFSCFCMSCKETRVAIQPTIVEGVIENNAIGKLYLFEIKGILGNTLIDSARIESNKFTFSIADLEEGYFIIRSSNSSEKASEIYVFMYLLQEDTVKILLKDGGSSFEGSSAYLHEYGIKAWDFLENDSLYKNTYKPRYEIPKLSIVEATSVIEKIREKQLNYFDTHFDNKLLPSKFKKVELAKIELGAANKYYWYLRYNKYMTEENTFEYLSTDSSYYSFLDRVDLNFEYNYLIHRFSNFLENHLNDLFFRTFEVYNQRSTKEYLKIAEKSELGFKAEWIKNNLTGINQDLGIYSLLNGRSFHEAILDSLELFYSDLKEIHEFLKVNFTDPTIYNKCSKIYEDYQGIEPGSKSPPLILPDSSGNKVALDSFLGSVVYIDFWGTWCGPCIEAIPDYRNLQKTFSDKEVVFLNVALEAGENGINNWKKFLNENDFPGIHVVAQNQFNNEQVLPFMIKWAPTYILIDREGKIAYPKAPKPKEAEDVINDLLSGNVGDLGIKVN